MKNSYSHREINKEPKVHFFDINESKNKTIEDNQENIQVNGNNNFLIFSKPSSLVKGIEIKEINEIKKEEINIEIEKEKENEKEKEKEKENEKEKEKEKMENNLIKLQKIEKIIKKRTHSLSPTLQNPIKTNNNITTSNNINNNNTNINNTNINNSNNNNLNNNNLNNTNTNNSNNITNINISNKNITINNIKKSPSCSKLRTLSPQTSTSSTIKNDTKKLKSKEKRSKYEKEISGKYFSLNDILQNKNIQIPSEYLNDIYKNLLIEEKEGMKPKAEYNYMKNQNEINEQMRSILIDWILDVHFKFGFTDETLFMTINIIDRYLTIEKITRNKLQLLGITSLMIACKHEEIDLPKANDFIYITDNAYNRKEVFIMENEILKKLNFSLCHPSPIKFYELITYSFKFNKKKFYMGKYLMESFLVDLKNIKYKPSIIACACVYIVMKFFKMNNYQESYNKKWFMLNENEPSITYIVKECAKDICLFVDNIQRTNFLSCQKKYSKNEFEKVSLLISGK